MLNRILKPVKTLLLPLNYYQGKNILITGGGEWIRETDGNSIFSTWRKCYDSW